MPANRYLKEGKSILLVAADVQRPAAVEQLKTLAGQRRRFGYRRLHILLRREGVELNHKKLFRLYREERLTVKKRGGGAFAGNILIISIDAMRADRLGVAGSRRMARSPIT